MMNAALVDLMCNFAVRPVCLSAFAKQLLGTCPAVVPRGHRHRQVCRLALQATWGAIEQLHPAAAADSPVAEPRVPFEWMAILWRHGLVHTANPSVGRFTFTSIFWVFISVLTLVSAG